MIVDMLIATVFKYLNDSQPAESLTHPAKRLTLPNFCGLHSGFLLDKEQNTLALIGSNDAFLLSFNNDPTLQDWINSIKSLADLGKISFVYCIFMEGQLPMYMYIIHLFKVSGWKLPPSNVF